MAMSEENIIVHESLLSKKLKPGASKKTISENIKKEKQAGKSQKQAVAIALKSAERARNEKRRLARINKKLNNIRLVVTF